MYPDTPDDFNDPFGGPLHEPSWESLFYALDIQLILLLLAIIIGVAVGGWCVGHFAGQHLHRKLLKASVTHAYDSIDWHLRRASEAEGGLQLQYARELLAVIEARLGHLRTVRQKSGQLFDDLRKALEAPDTPPEEASKPLKVKYDKTINQQSVEVWQALHRFRQVWDDKVAIIAMIEAAQVDMGDMMPDVATPPKEAAVAPSAESVAAEAPAPQSSVTSPSGGGGKGKRKPLPKHKKNMLA